MVKWRILKPKKQLMIIKVQSFKILKFLVVVMCFLLFLNVLGVLFKYNLGNFYVNQIFSFFDFDTEDSVPTVFSFLLLLSISGVLFIVYSSFSKKKFSKHWLGLSMVFLFLSFDEILSIHENFIPLLKGFDFTGIYYFSWIIPYSILVLILFILYLPFLLYLPKKTALYFVVSGLIYVIGALGLEAFEGKYFEQNGYDINFAIFYTFEELLEMVGLSLFLFSLIRYKFQGATVQLIKV